VKLAYSKRFLDSLAEAPPAVQKAFLKQSQFLLADLQHPSLRAKKYGGLEGIWQARVNRGGRFYFSIEGDVYPAPRDQAPPKMSRLPARCN
jgi:mRNA-degrading endonuclease RelE of RelBE toxin-antitoxin system